MQTSALSLKKGDKHNAINYRLVSLSCILCKLCEHIISSNIMPQLEKHFTLYDLPFRLILWNTTCLVYKYKISSVPLTKTNTCYCDWLCRSNWQSPSQKKSLQTEILRYQQLDTKDFLKLRKQTVILEGIHSAKIHVTSGVHQGTVLGPVLLIIYINDFNEYPNTPVRTPGV